MISLMISLWLGDMYTHMGACACTQVMHGDCSLGQGVL